MGASEARAATGRRRELDAMRLLVVFGLFLFHSALIFDPTDDYYIKNPQTNCVVTYAAAPCAWCGRCPCSSSWRAWARGSPCGAGRRGASSRPVCCGWGCRSSPAPSFSCRFRSGIGCVPPTPPTRAPTSASGASSFTYGWRPRNSRSCWREPAGGPRSRRASCGSWCCS